MENKNKVIFTVKPIMKFLYQKRESKSQIDFNKFSFLKLVKERKNKQIYQSNDIEQEHLFLKVLNYKRRTRIKLYISFNSFSFLYIVSKCLKFIFIFGLFLMIGVSLSFLFDPSWQTNGKIEYATLIKINLYFFGIILLFSSIGDFIFEFLIRSNRKLASQVREIKRSSKLKTINFVKYFIEIFYDNRETNSKYENNLNSSPIIYQSRCGGRFGLISYTAGMLAVYINKQGVFLNPIIGKKIFISKEEIKKIKPGIVKTKIEHNNPFISKKIVLYTVLDDQIIQSLIEK